MPGLSHRLSLIVWDYLCGFLPEKGDFAGSPCSGCVAYVAHTSVVLSRCDRNERTEIVTGVLSLRGQVSAGRDGREELGQKGCYRHHLSGYVAQRYHS